MDSEGFLFDVLQGFADRVPSPVPDAVPTGGPEPVDFLHHFGKSVKKQVLSAVFTAGVIRRTPCDTLSGIHPAKNGMIAAGSLAKVGSLWYTLRGIFEKG